MKKENERGILVKHKNAYRDERKHRWIMEEEYSGKILETVSNHFLGLLLKRGPQITYERLDKEWFKFYAANSNEWVKGCPNYRIVLKSREISYLYLELKIKNEGVFKKTLHGDKTAQLEKNNYIPEQRNILHNLAKDDIL
jgi:hypothetical protein